MLQLAPVYPAGQEFDGVVQLASSFSQDAFCTAKYKQLKTCNIQEKTDIASKSKNLLAHNKPCVLKIKLLYIK